MTSSMFPEDTTSARTHSESTQCRECRSSFPPSSKLKVFCSPVCRYRYNHRRQYQANREEMRRKGRLNHQANREINNARSREWYYQNKEKHRISQKRWRDTNPEKIRQAHGKLKEKRSRDRLLKVSRWKDRRCPQCDCQF